MLRRNPNHNHPPLTTKLARTTSNSQAGTAAGTTAAGERPAMTPTPMFVYKMSNIFIQRTALLRAVIQLGGYNAVVAAKKWKQVAVALHLPGNPSHRLHMIYCAYFHHNTRIRVEGSTTKTRYESCDSLIAVL